MLELKIDISELDYADLLAAVLPYIDLKKAGLPTMLANAVSNPDAIRTVLGFIPKDKQEEILLSVFEKNEVRMIAGLHKLAEKHGVRGEICGLTLKKKGADIL